MSVSSVSSSTTATTASTASTSTASSSFSDSEFMTLLVEQLQNQNPLEPTDASQLASQMLSYASYSQQVSMNDTLASLSSTMTSLSSTVSSLYSSVEAISSQLNISA